MRCTRARECHGQATLEYVGILFVIAGVLVVLTGSRLGGTGRAITDKLACALSGECEIEGDAGDTFASAPRELRPADPVRAPTAGPTARASLRRKCHDGYCGLEFSRRETLLLYRATVAGGTAAAATACIATGVPVACVAAAAFMGVIVADGTTLGGRCLFFGVGYRGTRWSLERC